MTNNEQTKGHYFNKDKKALKGDITQQIVHNFCDGIKFGVENDLIEIEQDLVDVTGSVMIMFCREAMYGLYLAFNLEMSKEQSNDAINKFLDSFSFLMKEEMNRKMIEHENIKNH